MTWIYAENNVNNIKVFSVFLGSAHTEPSLFLLFIPSHKGGDWDCMRIWEGTQLWPHLTQGTFYIVCLHKSWRKLGEESRRHLEWWCLSSPITVKCTGALISGDGHLPTLRNGEWFPCLPWSGCSFCFTYLRIFISPHEFSHFYLSNSLPHPSAGGVNKWLRGAWLPDGHKAQHKYKMFRKMWGFISFSYLWQRNWKILSKTART